jgi:ligand-binding sensor domain-containing protein
MHQKSRLLRVRVCGVALLTVVACYGLALDSSQPASGYIRRDFTIEDGRPANEVNAIIQTRNGFLWIATDGGLARSDGQHFTPIRLRAAVSEGVPARALVTAPDGALVELYHPGPGLSDQVICLHLSRAGVLWAGTFGGLYCFDGAKFVSVIPREMISRVKEASNGHLLVITGHGFVEWDGSRIIGHPELAPKLRVGANEIYHVFEDHNGVTWYCTSGGVARRINDAIEELAPYAKFRSGTWRVYEDPEGNIWVAGQLALFRAAGTKLVRQELDLKPTFMYSDKGDLWIANGSEGLVRVRNRVVRMYGTADVLPTDVVMTVLSGHDGTLWAGNNCGGLSRFDGRRFRTFREKDGLSNSCVWALAEDDNRDLWIGTWGGGLYRFRDGHFTQYPTPRGLPSAIVVSVTPARDGSIWMPTAAGLTRMRNGRFRNDTTADGLSSERILTVYQDHNGTSLAGTSAASSSV